MISCKYPSLGRVAPLTGWGALLIPGANDDLILIGRPLLRPYAWLALATMYASIVIALLIALTFAKRALAEAGAH